MSTELTRNQKEQDSPHSLVKGCTQQLAVVSREVYRRDTLRVSALKPPQTLTCLYLPHLHNIYSISCPTNMTHNVSFHTHTTLTMSQSTPTQHIPCFIPHLHDTHNVSFHTYTTPTMSRSTPTQHSQCLIPHLQNISNVLMHTHRTQCFIPHLHISLRDVNE